MLVVKRSSSDYIEHHGIKEQKWGVRNGPPYPLSPEDYSQAERKSNLWRSFDSNRIDRVHKLTKKISKNNRKLAKLSAKRSNINRRMSKAQDASVISREEYNKRFGNSGDDFDGIRKSHTKYMRDASKLVGKLLTKRVKTNNKAHKMLKETEELIKEYESATFFHDTLPLFDYWKD